jgi:hypothetical protein
VLTPSESETRSFVTTAASASLGQRSCGMETKKRHVSDDSEVSLPKKRAIADAHGSPTPHTNGSITTDEPKDANIEVRVVS